MDRTLSTISIEDAEAILGSARRTALLATQQPSDNDTREAIRNEYLSLIRFADDIGTPELVITVDKLRTTLASDIDEVAFAVCLLDAVVQFESIIYQRKFDNEEDEDEMLETFERSFRAFGLSPDENPISDTDHPEIRGAAFEFDTELHEVFMEEAEEHFSSFDTELEKLNCEPENSGVLWELKRIMHTFKGAAGAVGLRDAAELADSIEDDLEYATDKSSPDRDTCVESLRTKITEIRRIVAEANGVAESLSDLSDHSMAWRKQTPSVMRSGSVTNVGSASNSTRKPVIRISIDALDQLRQKAEDLSNSITKILGQSDSSPASISDSNSELLKQLRGMCELTNALQNDICSIRMVEFGILTTRLQRAVRVACEDGSKTAEIRIDNPNVRFDTLVLDALVEPLMHLLRNAVVHGVESPDSRRLIGKPENGLVRLSLQEDEKEWTIEVSDDGRGIDLNALRSKAVQMGVLSHESAERMGETATADLIFQKGLSTAHELSLLSGRGVGMSIVREAVERLNGTIELHAKNTVGTTFTIKLPRSNEYSSTNVRESFLILTVDDSESIRIANRLMIESCGYCSITSSNGSEAIATLDTVKEVPDLILTDLEMPEMDGLELVAALKSDPRFAQIPLIVVSSNTEPEKQLRAKRLGAAGWVKKPLDGSKLETVVKEFLGATI